MHDEPDRSECHSFVYHICARAHARGHSGWMLHNVTSVLAELRHAMLFDVSLPPITILHLSAPSARLVLIDIDWDRDRMQRITTCAA